MGAKARPVAVLIILQFQGPLSPQDNVGEWPLVMPLKKTAHPNENRLGAAVRLGSDRARSRWLRSRLSNKRAPARARWGRYAGEVLRETQVESPIHRETDLLLQARQLAEIKRSPQPPG